MIHGLWFMFVVYGLWFVVYGLWFMVYGLWFMVYGLWFMVYGLWFMVSVLLLTHLPLEIIAQPKNVTFAPGLAVRVPLLFRFGNLTKGHLTVREETSTMQSSPSANPTQPLSCSWYTCNISVI